MVGRRPALEVSTGKWVRPTPIAVMPFRPSGCRFDLTADGDSNIALYSCTRRGELRLAPPSRAMDDAVEVVAKILPALMKNAEAAYIDSVASPVRRAALGINLENR